MDPFEQGMSHVHDIHVMSCYSETISTWFPEDKKFQNNMR